MDVMSLETVQSRSAEINLLLFCDLDGWEAPYHRPLPCRLTRRKGVERGWLDDECYTEGFHEEEDQWTAAHCDP